DVFEHVRDQDGCAIAMRPPSHAEGAAMRADCSWPDVDPVRLVDLLSHYEGYPDLVFPIDEARVVREEADRSLVYQRQSMIGIADREVLLWIGRADAGAATTFSWSVAADEPLDLRPGAIRTPKNTGYWSVEPLDGGSHVVHEIAMDAGGSIPAWIVNLVRTRSFAKIMSDVRACAVSR
ncbi:MAG: hypothetical protein KC621_34330, partial [Myxococcales bacterium]|nr:hypothetical protein [Myxococcales bacterium]